MIEMYPGKVWQEFIDATERMSAVEFLKYCNDAFMKDYNQQPNEIIAMYQDRSEDLDPRVSKVLNEGPKILSAIEKINDHLKDYYNLKEQTSPLLCGFKRTQAFFNYIDNSYIQEKWDYTKEFSETLQNLNESCLNAYITFLEAEREALIQRWNKMAKDLKEKKK